MITVDPSITSSPIWAASRFSQVHPDGLIPTPTTDAHLDLVYELQELATKPLLPLSPTIRLSVERLKNEIIYDGRAAPDAPVTNAQLAALLATQTAEITAAVTAAITVALAPIRQDLAALQEIVTRNES